MRKKALVVVAVLAAVAAVAASASTRGPEVAVPQAAKPAKKTGPLLGVAPGSRGPVLGRASARSLWIGRRSPKLRLYNNVRAWAYGPEGTALAVVTQPDTTEGAARIQFVDPMLLRRTGLVRLPWGYVSTVAWGDGRVNVVLGDWEPGQLQVASVDAATHRVRIAGKLAGSIYATKRVGGTIVLLLGPERGIGTARLAVVDPSGALRSVELPQIQVGRDMEDGNPSNAAKMRQNIPGLAVDPDAGRAFVVPAAGRIAQVELASLSVSYHSLVQPVSLLGRLHDWAEPKAVAKGANGPIRTAQWLGSGVMAVAGGDETATFDSGQMHVTWTPAGLTLIDTNTWGTKVIDRGADSVSLTGDTLLVTGSSWSDSSRSGMGLATYGLDGTRKVSVLRGDAAYLMLAFRGKAYLDVGQRYRMKVVDLASGRLLKDRRAPIAQLLIGAGSD